MKMKIGKATDGLVSNPKNRKPRFYVVVWTNGKYVAVVKVYTTDPTNKKNAEKLENKLRKMIRNFGGTSAIDKKLYTTKKSGELIKHSELNYELAKHFTFDKDQSESIYKFVIEEPANKKALDDLIVRISSLKK